MSSALGERDGGGVVKDFRDLWVYVHQLVGLNCTRLVPIIDLGQDPFVEVATGENAEDVDNPLLW